MHKMKSSPIDNRWIALLRVIEIGVLLGFFVFSMLIGGSAFLGYRDSGHFFVRDHANIVEVSALVWKISYAWGSLFSIIVPLALGVEVVALKMKKTDRN